MATPKLFKRILVPHDFSSAANEALDVAGALAAKHGGLIVVLHVVTPPFYGGPDSPTRTKITWAPLKTIAKDRLARLERLVRARLGRSASRAICKVAIGEAAPTILAAAKAVDSIVMSTLGRSGLSRFLIGSVATKVVRHATVPVLTVRPRTTRRRK